MFRHQPPCPLYRHGFRFRPIHSFSSIHIAVSRRLVCILKPSWIATNWCPSCGVPARYLLYCIVPLVIRGAKNGFRFTDGRPTLRLVSGLQDGGSWRGLLPALGGFLLLRSSFVRWLILFATYFSSNASETHRQISEVDQHNPLKSNWWEQRDSNPHAEALEPESSVYCQFHHVPKIFGRGRGT